MVYSVYQQREEILAAMPVWFGLGEFRAAARLSRDAAWQTCRHWAAAGLVRIEARGVLRRQGIACALPAVLHHALAAGATGYFTGRAALQLAGLLPGPLNRLDLVVAADRTRRLEVPGAEVRRHAVGLARRTLEIRELCDGGRRFRVASPERALVDAVAAPGRFMEQAEVAAILARQRRRLDAERILELASRFESEALRRRLRVVAAAAGLRRLARWLEELGAFCPNMGNVRLDPSRPAPFGSPVEHGVILNVPLLGG
ncbi:MAG TPA: hypothetical protein PKN61_05135 [Acidobacteriota bacterium]|nr:hypothetical protein [Acidobacteriota bacterium]